MPRKPNPEVEPDESELEIEDAPESSEAKEKDAPFDPWDDGEEEADRRRDPLRSPVA
jgi:hypothetical protein